MNLFCVGINHRSANVATREQFSGYAQTPAILRERDNCAEALVLTTCNRVEVYAAAPGPVSTETVVHSLRNSALQSPVWEETMFYRHDDVACTQHLFRVASGLDSMVVGETEILGQTKRAYEIARETGAAGPMLHRLFQRAFRVAKQVRTRTQITRGSVSVGSVAVDLAEKIFGELGGRKVLLIGAGETSEKTARALSSRGVADLRVTNRSFDHAQELAAQFGGRAIAFVNWPNQCREVDILISSTSSEEALVTREMLAPIIAERADRPLFIIDIAVPRDVAPNVNDLDGVYLYDIDSLQTIADQSLALRRNAIAEGEAIIVEHVDAFRRELERSISGVEPEGNCREKLQGAQSLRVSES